jgi:V/A-type H+/Na+-transporting ATPase subunit K
VILWLTSEEEMMEKKRGLRKKVILAGLGILLNVFICVVVLNFGLDAAFGQEAGVTASATHPENAKWGYIAAAIAVSFGSIAAGIAVGAVGAAAIGALGEHPELAARALIFVGLAEGIAIYGLIIAIMILGRV